LSSPERVESFVKTSYVSGLSPIQLILEWTHPAYPSSLITFDIPSLKVFANGGKVVCILTLMASNGHNAISAKNSALALAPRKMAVLFAFGNNFSPYKYLKTS